MLWEPTRHPRLTITLCVALHVTRFLTAVCLLFWGLYENVPVSKLMYRDFGVPANWSLSLVMPISDLVVINTPAVIGAACAYTFFYLVLMYLHGCRGVIAYLLDALHCAAIVAAIAVHLICLNAAEDLLILQALRL